MNATAAAYDASNPTAPVRLGHYEAKAAFMVHDLSVVDGIAYLDAMAWTSSSSSRRRRRLVILRDDT